MATLSTVSAIEQMCDQSSKVDRMQCRGELVLGMKQEKAEQLLGQLDARSASGRRMRYADRVLTFDESGYLIEISQSQQK